MAAKLRFLAAGLLVAFASGTFLGNAPRKANPALGGTVQFKLEALNSKEGLSAKELEELEDAIAELVTKGDDPATKMAVKQMSDFIVNTLIPNRQRSQKYDQQQLDAKVKELANCAIEKRMQRDMNINSKVTTAEQHQSAYKQGVFDRAGCLQILEGKALVRDAHCASVTNATKVCHCDKKFVKMFGSLNTDCKAAPEVSAANRKCCDAFYEHAKHSASCANGKNNAEYAQKQHEIIMEPLCAKYDKCYAEKLESFKFLTAHAKIAEKARAWPQLYRIQCLVGEFKHGKVSKEKAEACKKKHYDIKGIEYPKAPAKEACKAKVHA